jgi:hypothetical protein
MTEVAEAASKLNADCNSAVEIPSALKLIMHLC